MLILLEKKLTLTQKILYFLSSKYWQSKLNSNESTNNHIYPEGIYKQPYNKRKNEKRAFRSKVNYGKKYKVKTIVVDKNMKRDVLMKNWSFPSEKKQIQKDEISNNPIIWDDDWKIIPRWWEVNEIIYKAHINPGFHLKIEPTSRKIEEMGYKWTNMENSVRNFYFEWEKWQQRYQKPKKNQTVTHIESTRPKERFVIDVVYLNDFISTTHRYLITMVDHFSKYGWAKIAKDKTANTILRTLKQFFTYHGCPEVLQSDNGKEFVNDTITNYLQSK